MAERRFSNSAASTGNRPQNTTAWTSLKPGSIAVVWRLSSVMVSPTRVSATSLIEPVKKPTSPGPSASISAIFGRNTPIRSTPWTASAPIMRMVMPFLSTPSMTRTSTTTPR